MSTATSETVWKLVEYICTPKDENGQEAVGIMLHSEGRSFAVSVVGRAPVKMVDAINALRAAAAHMAHSVGVKLPDARAAEPGELAANGPVN